MVIAISNSECVAMIVSFLCLFFFFFLFSKSKPKLRNFQHKKGPSNNFRTNHQIEIFDPRSLLCCFCFCFCGITWDLFYFLQYLWVVNLIVHFPLDYRPRSGSNSIQCPMPPPLVEHAVSTYYETACGWIANYSCYCGYDSVGFTEIMCRTGEGIWTTPPICIRSCESILNKLCKKKII